jgi:protein-S-isoprenylcysteine O-methyltransferase Ste14
VFVYGAVSYSAFFATFLYAVGFLGNIGVPKSIDSGPQEPFGTALAVDAVLLALFAVQHSVMARPWFKRVWTSIVPESAERSTYVLLSSVALALLFWQWRPLGGTIWTLDGAPAAIMTGLFAIGLGIVLLSTFLINHFDLFGLRQVYLYLIGKPYTQLEFRTPFFYRFVRHPLYVGWLLSFWCTPVMTSAHFFFALMTTAYILVGIRFEEADLVALHGRKYREYREDVPMLMPSLRGSRADYDDVSRIKAVQKG